jgi:pimeloyl-ACP methyl ester carboxylesterase
VYHRAFRCLSLVWAVLWILPARAGDPPVTKEIVLRQGLAIGPVTRLGRNPLPVDPIADALARGSWSVPKEGDAITAADGKPQQWASVTANEKETFNAPALGGGYAYFAVPSDRERVMILDAAGHAMVYVNGEPRGGNMYQTDYVRLPVLLRKGTNHLLFHVARGSLRVRLSEPTAAALLNPRDALMPDLLVGKEIDCEGALPILNASAGWYVPGDKNRLVLRVEADGDAPWKATTAVPALWPLATRKVAFRITGPAPKSEGEIQAKLTLERHDGDAVTPLDTATIELRVLDPNKTHKRTFRSAIDDSVQYYALVPANAGPDDPCPGLTLTLHGAGVEAIGQAACYTARSWTHVVAPTNRRPYGFDWEDWGRLDAIEVLKRTQKELDSDPRRTYLTGHSMGGHGTWHLGATYPGRFAAIGPSAGWVSMWSYAGAIKMDNSSPLHELVLRCANASDTLALSRNFAAEGVYVLHGDRDDNVPVAQARTMRRELQPFHKDFAYHEQPGVGHWWGKACVDWGPMFDFFQRRTLPAPNRVRCVDFTTASPGVSAWLYWAAIEGQVRACRFSRVKLELDAQAPRVTGSTTNVSRLAIDVGHLKATKAITVQLDGLPALEIPWPEQGTCVRLERDGERWAAAGPLPAAHKNPERYGPFRDVFRHRMIFVYGTQGTPEENAWALAKARFDAETFWYRGNGAVALRADTDFDAMSDRDRNVILYGNAHTNRAWKALLGESPAQVTTDSITIGERSLKGGDLACLFLRPRPSSDSATVGVIGGTGIHGMRLTDRLPLFVSGVGYPDCMVFGGETLAEGFGGVRVAGFFGADWSVQRGEFVWR